jgi:hypothetical protein
MAFRRTALILGVIGVLGASLLGAAPATAAPSDIDVKETATAYLSYDPQARHGNAPSGGIGTQSNCPVTSSYGHGGGYICETQRIVATWVFNGQVFQDDVVIGTDFFVYTDPGGGWGRLRNGEASHSLPLNQLGLFIVNSQVMSVNGTDNALWCISIGLVPHSWNSWFRC